MSLGACFLLSVARKAAGDTRETAGMVKYGQVAAKTLRDRLAKFAWGSQDGAPSHAAEDLEPPDMQPMPMHSDMVNDDVPGRISPLPPRDRLKSRGRSLDRLGTRAARCEKVCVWGGDPEPSLMQIMAVIHLCQSTLTDHIEGLRLEFSFLKQDVQKVGERTAAAEQCISSLEDTVRPQDTAAQIAKTGHL